MVREVRCERCEGFDMYIVGDERFERLECRESVGRSV